MNGVSRQLFSKSNDTVKEKIWRERLEPYIHDEIYKVEKINSLVWYLNNAKSSEKVISINENNLKTGKKRMQAIG